MICLSGLTRELIQLPADTLHYNLNFVPYESIKPTGWNTKYLFTDKLLLLRDMVHPEPDPIARCQLITYLSHTYHRIHWLIHNFLTGSEFPKLALCCLFFHTWLPGVRFLGFPHSYSRLEKSGCFSRRACQFSLVWKVAEMGHHDVQTHHKILHLVHTSVSNIYIYTYVLEL